MRSLREVERLHRCHSGSGVAADDLDASGVPVPVADQVATLIQQPILTVPVAADELRSQVRLRTDLMPNTENVDVQGRFLSLLDDTAMTRPPKGPDQSGTG